MMRLRTVSRRWCGLVATLEGSRTTTAVMERACDRIVHRGPDGRGLKKGKMSNDVEWAIGHTRLAIVAPNEKAAAQPFELDDHVDFAANGEIYAHHELWNQLVEEGYEGELKGHSDCEVIGHLYKHCGPEETMRRLESAGMFAFVLINKDSVFAARDPVGIKPLYYGTSKEGKVVAFASELKALVEVPDLEEIREFPPGHYLYQNEFKKYYDPQWTLDPRAGSEDVRQALDKAVERRMMTDVPYGLFLSGGIDSCIVGQLMVAKVPTEGIPSFTVGMAGSPDLMAARAMSKELKTVHHERIFTAEEAVGVIDKVVYHMETYNAELIRSAVPNYFLAELASKHVKMVLTGEGADELWAGYAYFRDAPSPEALQKELVRIYGHLGVANLLRTDRMTMAHSLEARVPFLDVKNTATAMSVLPALKMPDPTRDPGEKAFLRTAFEREHHGVTIPYDLLWRPKAMQCEGVGMDWVSILQKEVSSRVSDEEMAKAAETFPHETPQSKEEYYYRRVFNSHYGYKCDKVPTPWPGGCRAGGAEWQSDTYTRFGLANVDRLKHAYMEEEEEKKVAAA